MKNECRLIFQSGVHAGRKIYQHDRIVSWFSQELQLVRSMERNIPDSAVNELVSNHGPKDAGNNTMRHQMPLLNTLPNFCTTDS